MKRKGVEKPRKNRWVTGISAADHEDARGEGDEFAEERAESGVSLVPIEGSHAFLRVPLVPVHGIAVVVGVALRRISHHPPPSSFFFFFLLSKPDKNNK